jgi:hypothetical protein
MKSFSSCHVAPPEPSSAKKKQPSPMASNSNSTIPTTIYSRTSRSTQTIPNRRPGAPKANGQPVKLEGHAPANPAPENPAPVPAAMAIPAQVPPAQAIPAPVTPAQARVAPIEQILRTPRTPESRAKRGHAKRGHAKVLRIAVVLADLAPTRTEPRQAGRDPVPLNVVGPEWAALNPAAQNAEAQNLVVPNAVVQNPAVQNAEAQNLAGQNAAVAVAVRKASKVFSLFVSPPSVSFPRASRLACRCKIDTLRTVGNPWHAGAIPKAPLQGLPI